MELTGKLAFFVPSLAGGGAERVMLNLARGFAERGYAVDLVLASKSGAYVDDVPDTLRLIGLGRKKVSTSIPRLVSYISRERPAALISAMTHCNIAAIVASLICHYRVPVIATEHIAISASRDHSNSRIERLLVPLARRIYPKARGIIAVSHGAAKQLETALGLSKGTVSVVYNPIVSEALKRSASEPLDHAWFASGEPPVVIAAGRLSTQKDFGMLIEAFSLVRKGRAARLFILGEGEKRAELQRLINSLGLASDVTLAGFARNPFKYMKQAHAFVLSSRFEGLPTVIVEAMACGTPIVSTDCPTGPSEILENGQWGRLVPVGDAIAMAAAIETTLDEEVHPDVVRRADQFTIDRSVDGYRRVIGSVLAPV